MRVETASFWISVPHNRRNRTRRAWKARLHTLHWTQTRSQKPRWPGWKMTTNSERHASSLHLPSKRTNSGCPNAIAPTGGVCSTRLPTLWCPLGRATHDPRRALRRLDRVELPPLFVARPSCPREMADVDRGRLVGTLFATRVMLPRTPSPRTPRTPLLPLPLARCGCAFAPLPHIRTQACMFYGLGGTPASSASFASSAMRAAIIDSASKRSAISLQASASWTAATRTLSLYR